MKQIKADLEWAIKEIEDFLKQEENVGVINHNTTYQKGKLDAYQSTLNEINYLLEQLNK
jgi:hypothetical protein